MRPELGFSPPKTIHRRPSGRDEIQRVHKFGYELNEKSAAHSFSEPNWKFLINNRSATANFLTAGVRADGWLMSKRIRVGEQMCPLPAHPRIYGLGRHLSLYRVSIANSFWNVTRMTARCLLANAELYLGCKSHRRLIRHYYHCITAWSKILSWRGDNILYTMAIKRATYTIILTNYGPNLMIFLTVAFRSK